MAEGFSQTILTGNLGADPELRTSSQGNSVLKLRLATTKNYLDKNKQRQEATEWHSVVIFGKRCEGLAKVLVKGSRIQVIGENKTTSYDKDGSKRYKTEVVANSVILCGGERATGAPRTTPSQHEAAKQNGFADDDYGPTAADDDFPF